MTGDRRDARTLLDAWQASGADRVDPVRFRMLDAFARRAARHEGHVRSVLDERLAGLLAAYAADVERRPSDTSARDTAVGPDALAALNNYVASRTKPRDASWSELEMFDYFRNTWSRISTDVQLRQSRDQVPTNAGPLNSSSLVHRALSLMREQSPAYLQHFLAYVDALSWLEQMNAGDAPAPKETRRTTGAKKGAKSRAR
jgi:hypothetical protein